MLIVFGNQFSSFATIKIEFPSSEKPFVKDSKQLTLVSRFKSVDTVHDTTLSNN